MDAATRHAQRVADLAHRRGEEIDQLRATLAERERVIELYANADQIRQRVEAERDQARDAIRAMIEQLQLQVSFDGWLEQRAWVVDTEERRNEWREQAWQALHGGTLTDLGSRREERPAYAGDPAELDGHYAPD